jgi:hypothetical protein
VRSKLGEPTALELFGHSRVGGLGGTFSLGDLSLPISAAATVGPPGGEQRDYPWPAGQPRRRGLAAARPALSGPNAPPTPSPIGGP